MNTYRCLILAMAITTAGHSFIIPQNYDDLHAQDEADPLGENENTSLQDNQHYNTHSRYSVLLTVLPIVIAAIGTGAFYYYTDPSSGMQNPCIDCTALEALKNNALIQALADYSYVPVGAVMHAAAEVLNNIPFMSRGPRYPAVMGTIRVPKLKTTNELADFVEYLIQATLDDKTSYESPQQLKEDLNKLIAGFDLSINSQASVRIKKALEAVDLLISISDLATSFGDVFTKVSNQLKGN